MTLHFGSANVAGVCRRARWVRIATSALAVLVCGFAARAQPCGWTQLTHPAASPGDLFGKQVAIDGDIIAVGCDFDDVGVVFGQGTVQIFRFGENGWAWEAELSTPHPETWSRFGSSVAIDGDTLLVGALDSVGGNAAQGSVYVFTRVGAVWTQQARLVADDGAPLDTFGFAVALSGDTALIGARQDDIGDRDDQGSAYVFTRSGTTWTQVAKLTALDGGRVHRFGHSVAIEGSRAIVGATGYRSGTFAGDGAAYVFERRGGAWSQTARLGGSDTGPGHQFGFSLSLRGASLIVGAIGRPGDSGFGQGAAYVFAKSGSSWIERAILTASDGRAVDRFGIAVGLSDDLAVVGAFADDHGAVIDAGTAYVFRHRGGEWVQSGRIVADAAVGDQFGGAVALAGGVIAVGSDGKSGSSGAVYVFDAWDGCLIAPECNDIDFNNDFVQPDVTDAMDFLAVFGGGECSRPNCDDADFNNDGVYPDLEDVWAFLRVFSGGNC